MRLALAASIWLVASTLCGQTLQISDWKRDQTIELGRRLVAPEAVQQTTSDRLTMQQVQDLRAGAVCLVAVRDGGGHSIGSGVRVSRDWVFSAAHVFRDAGLRVGAPCTLSFPSGSIRGTLAGWHSSLDYAAVQVSDGADVDTIPVASAPAGERLYLAGHPSGQRSQDWYTAISDGGQRYRGTLLAMGEARGVAARQGHSGGPVFDSRGRLVGIISASDRDYGGTGTYCVPLSQVETAGYLPASYVQCFRGGGQRMILSPFAQQGTCPPTQRPSPSQQPIVTRPAAPSTPAAPTLTDDHLVRIADLIVSRMREDPEPWRGPAGPQGPAGVAPTVDQIAEQLPPIRLTFDAGERTPEITQEARLGGELRIPSRRVTVRNPGGVESSTVKSIGDPIVINFKAMADGVREDVRDEVARQLQSLRGQ